jgi:hypothetical protein
VEEGEEVVAADGAFAIMVVMNRRSFWPSERSFKPGMSRSYYSGGGERVVKPAVRHGAGPSDEPSQGT